MQVMDCVDLKEFSQKCEFFAMLPQAVPQFPKVKVLLHCKSMCRRSLTVDIQIAHRSRMIGQKIGSKKNTALSLMFSSSSVRRSLQFIGARQSLVLLYVIVAETAAQLGDDDAA